MGAPMDADRPNNVGHPDDARCPDCDEPASRTLAFGWLWRCDPCKREWGHPQWINTARASELLYELRNADGR